MPHVKLQLIRVPSELHLGLNLEAAHGPRILRNPCLTLAISRKLEYAILRMFDHSSQNNHAIHHVFSMRHPPESPSQRTLPITLQIPISLMNSELQDHSTANESPISGQAPTHSVHCPLVATLYFSQKYRAIKELLPLLRRCTNNAP